MTSPATRRATTPARSFLSTATSRSLLAQLLRHWDVARKGSAPSRGKCPVEDIGGQPAVRAESVDPRAVAPEVDIGVELLRVQPHDRDTTLRVAGAERLGVDRG